MGAFTDRLGIAGPYISGPNPCLPKPDTFSCWELLLRFLSGDGEEEDEEEEEEDEGILFRFDRFEDFRFFSLFLPRCDEERFFFLRWSLEEEEEEEEEEEDDD